MRTEMPDRLRTAFESHDAFESTPDGYRLTTTAFEAVVRGEDAGHTDQYTIVVHAPTLVSATVEDVGPALAESWRETLTRRLDSAPKSTRATVTLDELSVEESGEQLRIEFQFSWGNPDRAVEIAKTFIEYVEGTYVEGIVPGYEYKPPVSELLSDASQTGEGGTPL
jgi:hypothetical protein